jgi:hypothetical protein
MNALAGCDGIAECDDTPTQSDSSGGQQGFHAKPP